MAGLDALLALFRRNFPCAVRGDDEARRVLGDPENTVLTRRGADGDLTAACVIHRDAIYMLCVDAAYRRRGVGGALLAQAEALLRANGYPRAVIGAGEDYLLPGVPTGTPPFAQRFWAKLDCKGLDDGARAFFEKRGYVHGWKDGNCFDMRMSLDDFAYDAHRAGDTEDGVCYRWARGEDKAGALRCVRRAHAGFARYYADDSLYTGGGNRVLCAVAQGDVRGVLIVDVDAEAEGLGSVGCTAVEPAWRGRGIATRLVRLGTRHLKECNLREAFLSYTYSGLDKLYGAAGYAISAFYFMAEKAL